MRTRYRVGVQYVGTKYGGFAESSNSTSPTVMRKVQEALKRFCGERTTFANLKGSSRTDSGVHAMRNVCQFDLIRPATTDFNTGALPLNPYETYAAYRNDNTGEIGEEIETEDKKENSDGVITFSSASGSMFSNDAASTFYDPIYPPESIRKGLNYQLQPLYSQISVTDVSVVPPHFDVRHDALARTYVYRIICPNPLYRATTFPPIPSQANFHQDRAWLSPFPLNIAKMRDAAQYFLGEQDFSSIHRRKKEYETSVRHVQHLSICQVPSSSSSLMDIMTPPWENPHFSNALHSCSSESIGNSMHNQNSLILPDEEIRIYIRADSFVQRMVRNIVGILVAVGRNKLAPQDVPALLQLRDRKKVLIAPSPPEGLYLLNVHYGDDH